MNTVAPAIAVRFQNVSRHFNEVRAVDNVDLEIREGEFFAMLGPSGSGKTTCLRLIAGFEQPNTGHIEIFGETAEGVAPYLRQVNTVFQDYALFPHMSILDNVAYGLMVKGQSKQARYKKAEEALALVALPGLGARKPGQLSGGQRQRVALARALVNEPKVLLLDEPLGALDLKLREQMQDELKSLQRQLGVTFVFVTHDQGEALSMADRVAVFNHGRIVQVGTPGEVYERPANRFVASFVGSSNVLSPEQSAQLGGPSAWTSLRPERISIDAKPENKPGYLQVSGRVTHVHYQGATSRLSVALDGGVRLVVATQNTAAQQGESVNLAWPKAVMHVLSDAP